MPDESPPDTNDTETDTAPIVWHDHGERVFVKILCGECGARSQLVDVGPRFELAAVPYGGGVEVVARRVEYAFGLSLIRHHTDRTQAVAARAAMAACARMGLRAQFPDAGDVGPLAVLLCETETVVRAWPGDTRLPEIELLFHAADPNPLARATSALHDTWAQGSAAEVATRAMQWWSWRPAPRDV